MRRNQIILALRASLLCAMVVGQFAFATIAAGAIHPKEKSDKPQDGFLLESLISHEGSVIKSRVLMKSGISNWTKVGEGRSKKDGKPFVVEARANLVDSEVVEVETRIREKTVQNSGKLLLMLGEYGEITTAQMESEAPTGGDRARETKLGMRVVRVRY